MNFSFRSGFHALESLKWSINDMEHRADMRSKFTPDIEYVLSTAKTLLFVPDDLKERGPRHYLIKHNTELKARGAYTDKSYFHWWKDMGTQSHTIPLLATPEERKKGQPIFGPRPARICGELHRIDAHVLLNLDQHRLNGVQFERTRVKLIIPNREQKWLKDRGRAEEILGRPFDASTAYFGKWEYTEVWAWMYVGIRDYWDGQLDAGYQFHSVPIYKPNTNWIEYYSLYK